MKKSTPSTSGKAVVKAKPAATSSAALVAMPEPAGTLDRAGRANFFHELSREAGIVAIRAALAAGVELLQAKEELSGGFQKWVESKCSFSVGTAYRYIRLVQASLPEQTLPKLLSGSDAFRERKIEEVASSTDSRTLTELYDDLGIVRKTPSNLGGARPGAGRPKGGTSEGRRAKDPLELSEEWMQRAEAAANELGGVVMVPQAELLRAFPERLSVVRAHVRDCLAVLGGLAAKE